jgi:superfamily II DNA or RNA helicase
VRARDWRRECRAVLRDHLPPGGLRSAANARIDLLPHQLEPALAVVSGMGTRVLLADEVGLGKTIEAALIIAELRARGAADRVLVLTPPGLRDQWASELSTRFTLDAVVADVASMNRRSAELPIGMNPWSTLSIAVVSIDLVKRPEVLPALTSCSWDAVIVDEAHGAATGSDRHAAVAALASRAGYVVLVTATPHSGDRQAFRSLCGIGQAQNDPLLVFRRTRRDVHVGVRRRARCLRVRLTARERRMHALLVEFGRALQTERGDGAWLAFSVLQKRAASSARALELTVTRRLSALDSLEPDAFTQFALPWSDPSGELSADDEAPRWPAGATLANREHERRLLTALARAAGAAAGDESKFAVIARLLRRMTEPALIFTEYRDTLLHLAARLDAPAILHGGLTRDERRAAVESFTAGGRRVLLATDAGGEGLNLHHRCRLVVNLELPWTPTRLEQRIGRVDRIGQRRAVHAIHLVAQGTTEPAIFNRLKTRVATARQDIAVADPISADPEKVEPVAIEDDTRLEPRLLDEAAIELERLRLARQLAPSEPASASHNRGPLVLVAKRRQTRMTLGANAILLWTVACEDGCGRPVASAAIPLRLKVRHDRERILDLLLATQPECLRIANSAARDWIGEHNHIHRMFVSARITRRLAVAALLPQPAALFQASLFDRRGERAFRSEQLADSDARRLFESTSGLLERSLTLRVGPPSLRLVVI